MKRLSKPNRRPRGVAIVMVLVVLAALIILAAPFAISMLMHSRSARSDLNAEQARNGALAGLDHAVAHLHKVHNQPVLAPAQLKVDFSGLSALINDPSMPKNFVDPEGLLWSARIEDEQGKVNLHTAPPALIGNLLGSSTTTELTEKGARTLFVENARAFPSDGDPKTPDGYVMIGADPLPILYTHATDREIVLQPQGDYSVKHSHPPGALVYDGRGYFIAQAVNGPGGKFTPFRSIYEIKEIAGATPLRAIHPSEFVRIEQLVTIHSGLGGPAWGRAQLPADQSINPGDKQFVVEQGQGFGPGARLRIVQGGQARSFPLVERVDPATRNGRRSWRVTVTEPVGVKIDGTSKGDEAYLEPQLRHPVNVNTASPEVLRAVVTGVGLYGKNDSVSAGQAAALADFLAGTDPRGRGQRIVIADNEQLRGVLEEARKRGILNVDLAEAVFINATEPNSPKLRLSTVPFCFRSMGTFTVEGSGVINTPTGLQVARSTLRKIVTMPSPPPGHFELHSQEDFQGLLDQGLAARVVTWPVAMGNDTTRFFRSTLNRHPDPNNGDVRLGVGEVGSHVGDGRLGNAAGGGQGVIQLPRGPKDRSSLIVVPAFQGANRGAGVLHEFIDHCDDPLNKAFFQEGYAINRHGPYELEGVVNPQGNGFMPTQAVELWFKPLGRGGGEQVLFDHGEEVDRNRVTFFHEARRGLVVRVFDSGLEGLASEYTYPCELDGGRWYHVAGSWRSGHYNGQEARIDGQLQPPDTAIEFHPGSRLAGDLDIDEDENLELDDGADFPDAGAVQVGEEIIEYRSRNGNTLTQLTRGARMSAQVAHIEAEFVMPYGYACPMSEDLYVGGATLSVNMEGANSGNVIRTTVNHPSPPNKDPFVVDSETAKLPVQDATDFPPSGYLLCSGEIIHYKKRSATAFEQLTRGDTLCGRTGPARNLRHGAAVISITMQISKPGDYPQSGLVQVDNDDDDTKVEWIAYGDKVSTDGKHYLSAHLGYSSPDNFIQTGSPPTQSKNRVKSVTLGSFRGQWGTDARKEHAKGAKVIPVIRYSGPQIGNANSPAGPDGVSTVSVLTRGQADGDVRWIKRAYTRQYPNATAIHDSRGRVIGLRFTGWGFDYLAGLDDFVSRNYPRQGSRLLKFPSGEMPDVVPPVRHILSDMDKAGQLSGYMDEVKVLALTSFGGKVSMDTGGGGLSANGNSVSIELPGGYARHGGGNFNPVWPTTGGAVRIEDEVIYYQSASTSQVQYYADVLPKLSDKAGRTWFNSYTKTAESQPNIHTKTVVTLSGLKRGALGTTAADHPAGAGAMLYDAAPITSLSGGLPLIGDSFSVRDAKGFPQEGYAWIDDEIVSYTKRNGNGFSGARYFRGRYGTQQNTHAGGAVVQALPFRYWDREARDYDGPGLAYVQAGYYAEDAIWDTLELETKAPPGEPFPKFVQPRVVVRFDGRPAWDTVPTNKEGGLYEFIGRGVHELKGYGDGRRGGKGVKADQIEIRVYWRYEKGAFQPGQDWKATFGLDELRATYHSPMVVRRIDEIEKR